MKSIGKLLKAARVKQNYTISEVTDEIKIHPKYIKALEEDNYEVFEGKVHSKGFLKIYASFLKLDTGEILALWRREYESAFADMEKQPFKKINNIEGARFVITPLFFTLSTVFLLLFVFFGYLFFQYRQYTDAPQLEIFYPEDNLVVQDDVLDITGKAEIDSKVFINTQQIIANPDGSFVTSIKLNEGINTISIRAVNKLEVETEKIRNVIYRPEIQVPQQLEEETQEVQTDETSDQVPAEDIEPEQNAGNEE